MSGFGKHRMHGGDFDFAFGDDDDDDEDAQDGLAIEDALPDDAICFTWSTLDGWADQPRDERGRFGSIGTAGTGLTEGKHVKTLALRSNAKASTKARASLKRALEKMTNKAGLHGALAAHPLSKLAIVKAVTVRGEKSASAGVYNKATGVIQVRGDRPPGSWGKPFEPGSTWSMSHCAPTHDEAIARTTLHEIGHHLFHQDKALQAAAVKAYESHPRTTVGNSPRGHTVTQFAKPGFSRYAEKSASEYMSEALCAYVYNRAALKKYDPAAHALAEKMVSLRGLKVKK